jgi:hypothetical protein
MRRGPVLKPQRVGIARMQLSTDSVTSGTWGRAPALTARHGAGIRNGERLGQGRVRNTPDMSFLAVIFWSSRPGRGTGNLPSLSLARLSRRQPKCRLGAHDVHHSSVRRAERLAFGGERRVFCGHPVTQQSHHNKRDWDSSFHPAPAVLWSRSS